MTKPKFPLSFAFERLSVMTGTSGHDIVSLVLPEQVGNHAADIRLPHGTGLAWAQQQWPHAEVHFFDRNAMDGHRPKGWVVLKPKSPLPLARTKTKA